MDKKEFYIRGVKEEIIYDWQDALEKLKKGEINRHYARTVMNHQSSRSHTIFRVYVQSLSGCWSSKHEAEQFHSKNGTSTVAARMSQDRESVNREKKKASLVTES